MARRNFTDCSSHSKLSAIARSASTASPYIGICDDNDHTPAMPPLSTLLNADRLAGYVIPFTKGLFNFSFAQVTESVLDAFQTVADELRVVDRYRDLLSGYVANVSEKRSVMHHQTRSKEASFYAQERDRFLAFSKSVRRSEFRLASGEPLKHVVQIGIGGSELGPKAIFEGLSFIYPDHCPFDVHFVSNLDPLATEHILQTLNLRETLFILASKSGSTQEVLCNYDLIASYWSAADLDPEDLGAHTVCVTGKHSPLDVPTRYLDMFYINDAIGGRFSTTSAMGGVVLSIAFGAEIFTSFLEGAFSMDGHARQTTIRDNAPLMAALIAMWERGYLGYHSRAIIPYSEALHRFPAFLQQLSCESHGKQVDQEGELVSFKTAEVLFGEPGTQAQHSFFQLLHQGTDITPVEFIGFKDCLLTNPVASKNHRSLLAHLTAQMVSLAQGDLQENLNASFPGNRPSTLWLGQQLDAFTLGQLLSFYENKIMFLGFLWGVNTWDQEGVQLGKTLAKSLDDPSQSQPFVKDVYQWLGDCFK